MCDSQREKLKDRILSFIFDVAHPVGLFNIRSKDENTLINKYCNGISRLRESESTSEEEVGCDIILECFRESLDIPSDIEFKPNLTLIDFEDNLDTIFKSIGLNGGITDVLEANSGRNPDAKRLLKEAVARVDSIRGSKSWRSEPFRQFVYPKDKKDNEPFVSVTDVKEEINILTIQILQLPDNLCSKELKSKLSSKFSFVYELLSISFDELKQVLYDGDNIPIKLLIELEMFFRFHDIDFLSHIPTSSKYEDIIVRSVIRDSVAAVMTQIDKLKGKDF